MVMRLPFKTRNVCLTLLSLTLLMPGISRAQPTKNCQCLWQGAFAQVAKKADLVVSGKVVSIKGNSADFNIEKTLYDKRTNNAEFNDLIRIWVNDGKQCRPEIDTFKVGSEWVLALTKIIEDVPNGFNPNTPNISYGRINDYYLSKCGASWLHLIEGYVSGNLVQGRRWVWEDDKMNPVLLELVDAYLNDKIPESALKEAARPMKEEEKALKELTESFLEQN